ncbi:MAG: hypothetical protein IJD32_06900, partial [Bacteroidaceae bacterium]|nr:hypothetical protein [Bacteroidaceae bacterium]
MKKTILQISMLMFSLFLVACQPKEEAVTQEALSTYVNPLIGSAHCRWFHVAPGALPFGLAKPGPST